MKLTNKGLVAHCKALLVLLTCYVYGTYGKMLTSSIAESKAKQYPKQNTASRLKVYLQLAKQKYYATDCVGVIKSYLWGGIDKIKYVAATDKSANGMYNAAKKKGNVDYSKYKHGVPEVPGIAVQMDGHIGVYIGNGKVIESTPNTKYAKQSHKMGGVCETSIKDRKWLHWLYIPFIEYVDCNPYTEPTRELSKGCKGDDVKWVQYVVGAEEDGDFGKDTEAKVIAFQKEHQGLNIKRLGTVGKKTVKAMK